MDGHIDAISARISGHVAEVDAEDEQIVKAGDVLVRIDPSDYQVALDKAEADLADAEAALQTSRIDIPITSTNTASQLKTRDFGPRGRDRVPARRRAAARGRAGASGSPPARRFAKPKRT